MPGFVVRALGAALALMLAAYLLPGMRIESAWSVVFAAFLLGIVNAIVRPIVVLFTLPLTLLTLGAFLLVINALMIQLVDALVAGIVVDGFFTALIASLLVSLVSAVVSWYVGPKAKYEVLVVKRSRED